jgi:probable F420-dependent oxidoreductase
VVWKATFKQRRCMKVAFQQLQPPLDEPNARRLGRVGADMTVELGRIGIWRRRDQLTPRLAREAEAMGYGAIWIGGSPPGDLFLPQELLDATTHLAVATGIVNMWAAPATEAAASYRRIEAAHPGRFLLGVGIGHPEATAEYRSPYDTMVDYLDVLDAEGVPVEARVLAALGPKVLALAAERTAGAHPYLTTPAHTRIARETLGEGPLLAPEQKVVIGTDPAAARALGRRAVDRPYLHLRNYTSNLRRLGWTEADLADGGSDALIDALVVHGDAATVAAGVTAHLDAGADHVCVQVLTEKGADPLPDLRALAEALDLVR